MDRQEILDHYMAQVEKVKQGEINALDVGTELKEFSDAISGLYDELKDHIYEARDKYDKKEEVVRNGYKIVNMSRTNYSYSHWDEYKKTKDQLKNKKEQMKRAYQAQKDGQTIYSEETGEVVEPASVSFTSYPQLEYVGEQQL